MPRFSFKILSFSHAYRSSVTISCEYLVSGVSENCAYDVVLEGS